MGTPLVASESGVLDRVGVAGPGACASGSKVIPERTTAYAT
ncbi:MAG: hypothetical protein R2789_03530 [Microthrixaceae bacterium]